MSKFGDFFAKLLGRAKVSPEVDKEALASVVAEFVLESLQNGTPLVMIPDELAGKLTELKPGTYRMDPKDIEALKAFVLDPRNDIIATVVANIEVNRKREK